MLRLYTNARNLVSRLAKKQEGATAVEYGIMVALIAVVIIGTVTLVGQELDAVFQQVLTALQGI